MVLLVLKDAHVPVAVATGKCTNPSCSEPLQQLQPHHLLSWPATPSAPSVWYSYSLLEDASITKLKFPVGTRMYCKVRHEVHRRHLPGGQCAQFDTVWRNFGPAWERFRVSWMQLQNPAYLGLSPLHPGCPAGSGCPSCSHSAVAVNADACLGLVRMGKAAKSQRDRQPEYQGQAAMWVSPQRILQLLEERRNLKLESDCSEFRACPLFGRRSLIYEILGESQAECCQLGARARVLRLCGT